MIDFQIKGLDKLIKLGEKYPEVSEKYINTAISDSFKLLKPILGNTAPKGLTGNLRKQWKVTLERFKGTMESTAESGDYNYALAIEYGTRPHWVSIAKIKPWAEKKGINPWALQKSIATKGTKAQPFVEKSLSRAEVGINNLFKKAIDGTIKEILN